MLGYDEGFLIYIFTGFGLWIVLAGEFQIGDNIKPLDPNTVSSQVFYGKKKHHLTHISNGHSLVYNQLYPFEGLQNYTSGIIHHVRLKGLKLAPYNI